MTPFDQLAPVYASLWSESSQGMRQREQVWRELRGIFHPGDRILDLGCGTGDDALHLAERKIGVLGIDSSPAMVAIARSRGVAAEELAIEAAGQLQEVFDGALSNFGAWNCVRDVASAAATLARLVRPGGPVAICVLSRFYWRESLAFLRAGNGTAASRRWRGAASWRGITIYYRGPRQWRRIFEPYFELAHTCAIGGGDHRLLVFRRRA